MADTSGELAKSNRLAFVLGSGGLKPISAVSLLRLFEELSIEPDVAIGCSGGCFVACLWAAGMNARQIMEALHEFAIKLHENKGLQQFNYRTLLAAGNYPFGKHDITQGILHPDILYEIYHSMLGDITIESLPRAFMAQATDLETGEGVILSSGSACDALYASTALYPLFPPINICGQWLLDGAYHSAVPVLEAVKCGFENIIAVSFEEPMAERYDNFLDYYLSFVTTTFVERSKQTRPFAVNMHNGEMLLLDFQFDRAISIWDLAEIEVIFNTGDKMIEKYRDEITEFLCL